MNFLNNTHKGVSAPVQRSAEAALVSGLQARDAASFERLVRHYGGRLLSVARRFLRNEEDARDCVQQVFVQVFRAIDNFQGSSSLGTWLHRITVNEALSRLRSQARHPEESLDELLSEFDENGERIEPEAMTTASTEEILEREGSRELVHRAIDQLPEGYRNVLLLRDIEGYDTNETAALLGVTPGTVKTRLHRARAQLKKTLEPLLNK